MTLGEYSYTDGDSAVEVTWVPGSGSIKLYIEDAVAGAQAIYIVGAEALENFSRAIRGACEEACPPKETT